MLPHIHLLGMRIPMYSVMLAVGLLAFFALYLYSFRSEYRTDRVTFNRLSFSVCLSIGAMLLFAFLFDGLFHSIREGKLSFGGITWLGGVAGAFPAILLLTHFLVPRKRGYELDILDAVIPGIAVAHAFGRIGCFLGGCCFGKETDSVFGVSFPKGSVADKLYPNPDGTGSLPVLPTQLFEAAFELAIFFALLIISRKTKKYNTAIWSVSYGIFRFVLEFFRGDDRGSAAFSLSPGQMLSVILVIFGVLIILLRSGAAFKRFAERIKRWQSEADDLPIIPIDYVRERLSDPDMLRELEKLKDEGLITAEEYEKKRSEILERM